MLARRRREKIISFTLDKDGTFIWALRPGTTCWPGGGPKCSPGVGGSKMASRGVEWLLTPPTHTYACDQNRGHTKYHKVPNDRYGQDLSADTP